ncbi:hypothetical protein [Natronoarchaeum rubrum]|uniref:hypothetical protein n=1 Tax=Natronoarchaeum rubrum TaxID=755311 RepID=UPI0021112984|nr:hypothetical protein [Natronoarchaeum rubrum]
MSLDPDRLDDRLADAFGGTPEERRVVARQARDLADSGRYAETADHELTVEIVLDNLADAPEGSPAERWNWWMGALGLAFGGFDRFTVREREE